MYAESEYGGSQRSEGSKGSQQSEESKGSKKSTGSGTGKTVKMEMSFEEKFELVKGLVLLDMEMKYDVFPMT